MHIFDAAGFLRPFGSKRPEIERQIRLNARDTLAVCGLKIERQIRLNARDTLAVCGLKILIFDAAGLQIHHPYGMPSDKKTVWKIIKKLRNVCCLHS
jgi:hypothetical protein